MTNSNYSKIVEQYLEGEMSKKEVLGFEEMLQQDPVLKSELVSQQQIIEGLKDYRILELKGRLNNIDVTPGFFQTVASNSMVQVTSGVLLTGSLLLGGYLWMTSSEKSSIVDFQVNSKSTILAESEFVINPNLKVPTIDLGEILHNNTNPDSKNVFESPIIEDVPVAEDLAIIPNVVVPNLNEYPAEDDKDISTDEPNIAIAFPNKEQKQVEIENIEDSKYDFHYKFYNNKLYLYGDFRGIPYEIFEINGKSGKRLFLFHDNIYYRILDSVNEATKLQKVANVDLISDLDILRENKSQ
ncbi:MAG: hypothetical protein O2887_04475 [Bacteroidetes bacterium]|nr:hypothetical protein [Bacteroidota bacterium]MDA1119741.1 hypothetical protein [Bacteroidota bacterium]